MRVARLAFVLKNLFFQIHDALTQRGSMKYLQKRLSAQCAQWLSILSLCIGGSTLSASDSPILPQTGYNTHGDQVAVWGVTPDSGNSFIQANTLPLDDSWQTVAIISDTDHESIEPRFAINTSGDGVAAWLFIDEVAGVYTINTSMLSSIADNTWATPVIISTTNDNVLNDFQLRINEAGKITLLWTAYDMTSGDIHLWGSTAAIGDTSWTTIQIS